ncbi:MAG: putative metal-binding motif-containing protein [Nanoarchaeota archaeon]
MKKEVKLLISLSVILILFTSLASAGIIEDIIRNIFGGFPIPGFPTTGQVVNGGVCTDTDGTNYLIAGSVTKDGVTYNDYCDGNTNYDFICDVTAGGDPGGGGLVSFLPLTPSITGASVGNPTDAGAPPTTSANCQTVYGVPCNAGRCGCTDGTTKTCGPPEGNVGQCKLGTTTCSGGIYSTTCSGAVYPTAETCGDKVDNDCDGETDEPGCYTSGEGTPASGGECTSGTTVTCGRETGECNPGTKTCVNGYWGNCGGTTFVSPKTEICSNTLDENCDGYPSTQSSAIQSCDDPICDGQACATGKTCQNGLCVINSTQSTCTDIDNDKYAKEVNPTACGNICNGQTCLGGNDCNDTVSSTHPEATEICDGIDNSCKGQPDLGLVQDLNCIDSATGKKKDTVVSQCINGVYNFQSCEEAELITCGTTETPNNNIDDNCDGSIDEGSSCAANSVKDCTPESGNSCDMGQQKCTGGVWNSCQITGQENNCNQDSCTSGTADVCGSNIGICWKGIKYCQDGTWGECKDANIPGEEVCTDGLDNNCDGQTDETSCVSAAQAAAINAANSQSNGEGAGGSITAEEQSQQGTSGVSGSGAKSGATQKQETGFLAFLKKILSLLATIFRAGHFIGQPILDVTDKSYCSDSDLGKNYFSMGSGEGLNQQKTQIWFQDFCYEDDMNSKKEKCAGSNCFLKEYYCDGQFIASEPAVTCKYGCVNGACVPDASLNGNCRYFDKEQWKWVNTC